MDVQVWSKSQEKRANILSVRGEQVTLVKLTGNVFTLKKKVKEATEHLSAGQDPATLRAGKVTTFDASSIAKAEVSPGNGSLTLHGGPDGSTSMSFDAADDNAGEILQAILSRSGRTFRPTQEDIGVVEALIPPALVGVVGGLFWMGLYDAATALDAGQSVEVSGRRQGLKQLLVGVADVLGTPGTIAVGALLLALVLGWTFRRITKRPQRTVWLPESA